MFPRSAVCGQLLWIWSNGCAASGSNNICPRSATTTLTGRFCAGSAQWLADHEEPTRQGSRHRQNAPYQRMQTKDGYLMVGAAGEAIWARCAKASGHPVLGSSDVIAAEVE